VQLRQRAGLLVQLPQRARALRLARHCLTWPVYRWRCLARFLRLCRQCRWVCRRFLRACRRCRSVCRRFQSACRRFRLVRRWVLRCRSVRRCRWVLLWVRRLRPWLVLPARSSRLARRQTERLSPVSRFCLDLQADGELTLIHMRVGPAASNDASPGQTR